jgi:ferredoxin-NADP reductase
MVYTSKILRITKETLDTMTFFFERPANFKYNAGQYCIFEKKINEEIIRRSYSLSSSPTEQDLAITVRHIPNGKMTTYLFSLAPGEILTFNGAFGKFSMENQKKVVFIAGGSGVTPFRAMVKYALDTKQDANLVLVYGARSPIEILFDKELNSFLKHQNFRLYITVDKPDASWHFHSGFINGDFIKEATGNSPSGWVYFLCGPPVMITSVKTALMNLGVQEKDIMVDAWG